VKRVTFRGLRCAGDGGLPSNSGLLSVIIPPEHDRSAFGGG
jgi:hypothetical protein